MGCDIHTAVEVKQEDGSWRWTGEVFDSPDDWKYVPITEGLLRSVDDEQLLEVFDFHVLHPEYGTLRVSPEIRAVFESFDARKKIDGELVAQKREEVSERPEGWDYSIVKEYTDNLRLERARDYADSVTEEQREEFIAAALKYGRDETAKYEEDGETEGFTISFDRRSDQPPHKTGEPFAPRNYDLFAALADVRNGRGFAGVPTGRPIEPIDQPRGWPDDADPATLKTLSHEHSQSWLLLSEIDNYDWDKGKVSYGIVSGPYYDLMREVQGDDLYPWGEAEKEANRRNYEAKLAAQQQGTETDWPWEREAFIDTGVSGGISGAGIVTLSPEQYEAWKAKPPERRAGSRPYVHIQWKRPLREGISEEFFNGVEQMHDLIPPNGTADDVRLVFDFDS